MMQFCCDCCMINNTPNSVWYIRIAVALTSCWIIGSLVSCVPVPCALLVHLLPTQLTPDLLWLLSWPQLASRTCSCLIPDWLPVFDPGLISTMLLPLLLTDFLCLTPGLASDLASAYPSIKTCQDLPAHPENHLLWLLLYSWVFSHLEPSGSFIFRQSMHILA